MRVLFASFLLLFCTFLKAQNTTIVEHQHLTFCGISLNNTATAFADSLMAKGFKTETAPPQLPINKPTLFLADVSKAFLASLKQEKHQRTSRHGAHFLHQRKQSTTKLPNINQYLSHPLRQSHLRKLLRNTPLATRCATATGNRPFCNNIFCQWWHSSIFVAIQFSSIRIHLHPTAYQH